MPARKALELTVKAALPARTVSKLAGRAPEPTNRVSKSIETTLDV